MSTKQRKRQRTNVAIHGSSRVMNDLLVARLAKRIYLPPNVVKERTPLEWLCPNVEEKFHTFSQYSSFSAISIDCLSRIVDFLSGDDVEALYSCGNHRLNLNLIYGGCRKLDYFADGSSACKERPVFARKCIQHLLTLEVFLPRRDNTLGSFEWLRLIMNSNLTSLRLKRLWFETEDILLLPKSLTSFILQMECEASLLDESVSEFPSGMQTLHLGYNTKLSDACFIHLPRLLTSLEISSNSPFTNAGLLNLPPSLTHLRLGSAFKNVSSYVNDSCLHASQFQHLPHCLTSLILSGATISDSMQLLQLPPILKRLDISSFYQNDHSRAECKFSNLPRSLTHLKMGVRYLSDDDLTSLPPSLDYLDLSRINHQCTFTTISKLPRCLKTLIIATNTNSTFFLTLGDFLLLPPTLTCFKIHGLQISNITEESIARLPRSITTLHVGSRFLTDMCAESLPPNLVELCIYDYRENRSRCGLTNAFLLISQPLSLSLWRLAAKTYLPHGATCVLIEFLQLALHSVSTFNWLRGIESRREAKYFEIIENKSA